VAPSVISLDGFHTRTWLDIATAVVWPLLLVVTVWMVVAGFSAPPIGPGVPVIAALVLTAFPRRQRVELAQSRAALAKLTKELAQLDDPDRKSTRLNSSHVKISYAVFCL